MKGDLKVSTDDFLAELKQTYTIAASGLDRLAPTMPQEIDAGIAEFIIPDMLGALSTDASTLTLMLGDTRDSLEALISSFEQNEADTAAAFDAIDKQAQSRPINHQSIPEFTATPRTFAQRLTSCTQSTSTSMNSQISLGVGYGRTFTPGMEKLRIAMTMPPSAWGPKYNSSQTAFTPHTSHSAPTLNNSIITIATCNQFASEQNTLA